MNGESESWVVRFRPKTGSEIVDNKEAVESFLAWMKSWIDGVPEKRSVFLYGPPGVGKTSSVLALSKDLGFDVIEVNASDYRTGKRLEAVIGRSVSLNLTVTGKRRVILFDEMEGISGREDEGGISEIARIIKESKVPIILISTSIQEDWEKFSPLVNLSQLIEFSPIPFKDVLSRLKNISREAGIIVQEEALESIAEKSGGDLRSALNDLEAAARGKSKVTLEDVELLGDRDRQTYTHDALMKVFSAKTVTEARRVISSAYINYDDLFEWIYENLPYVLNDPRDLSEALDHLALADIFECRANRTQNFTLIKYMFTLMTGGVALSRRRSNGTGLHRYVETKLLGLGLPSSSFSLSDSPKGLFVKPSRYLGDDWRKVNEIIRNLGGYWIRTENAWLTPYFRSPQYLPNPRGTWHIRRVRDSLATKLSKRCHVSTKIALMELLPFFKIIFKGDKTMATEFSKEFEIDDKEEKFLTS